MGLFSSKIKCAVCGAEMDKGAKFCPGCGGAQGVQCRACGAAVAPGARFCPKCGRDVGESPVPVGESLQQNHWARLPEVFAQRIEADDLDALAGKGLHRSRLVVEPGVRAMIFQKGKYLGVLPQGTYPLETLTQRHLPTLFGSGVPTTAILIEEGDLDLRFTLAGLKSSDYHPVDAELSLLVAVKDPEAFHTHLMRGRLQMTLRDLRAFLEQEVRSIVAGYAGGHLGGDFTPAGFSRQRIEDELRQEMGASLARWGLELLRVRVANFACPELEEGLRRPEAELGVKEEKQKLTERAALLEQRARELASKDAVHKFQSEKDFKDYVAQVEHEAGLKNLLRKDELQGAQDDFDRSELTRAHALRRLSFELESESQRARRQVQGQFDEEDFERQSRRERLGLEQRLSNERLAFSEERERALTLQGDALARRLAEARSEKEIAALKLERERAEFELSMVMLERTKEVKRRERREETLLELEAEERRAELKMKAEGHKAQLRREYLESAKGASTEALLATAEGSGGEALSQHAQLKAKAAMSAEQLLALAAAQAPEAARALSEKFKAEGTSAGQQAALLREMLERQDRQREGDLDRIERLSGRAMDQLGAAAQAGAARPDAPHYAREGREGQGRMLGEEPKKVLLCPKCEVENPVGSKFCQFCGYKF